MAIKKRNTGFIRYGTYNFTEKDPVIDILRTAKKDADITDAQIARASNVSPTTLRNWFVGKTKRPQFATVAAAAVAIGLKQLPITPEERKKLKNG